ncbi:MAG: CBS domain-containing protein [Candidatus Omnitrophota bacterium]|nr:CBS domain-containing protein [Candidatus Omnitrophota bacterium]MDZ4243084.1 CBS domain-containing protein [Candidatus Omnitrophota bacterium]
MTHILNTPVENIMTDHPIKIKENVRVGMVAHLLLRYRINGVLVVGKNNQNRLVGIFTTTDMLGLLDEAFSRKGNLAENLKKVSDTSVGKVASRSVISVKATDKILKVLTVMHEKKVHTLPVFDRKELVGVISKHDLLDIVLR